MKPYFSICIPIYNRENLINRTLNSIVKQTFLDYEVIVIDDGSIDKSNDIVKQFIKDNPNKKIKLETKINGGKHTALNRGIKIAEGKFFIILDSDDYLSDDALLMAHNLIESYDQKFGIIGKAAYQDGSVIGDCFEGKMEYIDYVDFHFGKGFTIRGNKFGDCFECNKTKLLKKNQFPEDPRTKFVPESYIFDKIGLEDKLVCSNNIFLIKEYQVDGISNNYETFMKKNYIGFLYKYIDDLDNIFIHRKVGLFPRVFSWAKYWKLKEIDNKNGDLYVKKVSLLGNIVKISLPIILFAKKHIKHKNSQLNIK